jgi:hypothetical protein
VKPSHIETQIEKRAIARATPMPRYREKLYRLLPDGWESESDYIDEQYKDVAWNMKVLAEERSHQRKCVYCGEFYKPYEETASDGICNFCSVMEEFEARMFD